MSYHFAWREYCLLEQRLEGFFNYVPPDQPNREVWSPRLAEIITDSCSILASFFKFALNDPSLNNTPNIASVRKKDKQTIGDFRQVFNEAYNLSSKEVHILPLFTLEQMPSGRELPRFETITPFASWASDTSPKWWTTFTDLKHHWFKNVKKATLNRALESLAALFLIFVQHINSREVLIYNDVIQGSGTPHTELKRLLQHQEPFAFRKPIAARTPLFGYIYQIHNVTLHPGEILGPDSYVFNTIPALR